MSFMGDFKKFALKGNVVDLAVAVVIGGAFGKIVSALVDSVVMPVVGGILPGGNWRTYTVTSLDINLGAVLAALVDFTLIALVLFVVVVKVMGRLRREPTPTTRPCPECLEEIPVEARRCRACTSPVGAG
jgi:large conductance mechanosensitive channel